MSVRMACTRGFGASAAILWHSVARTLHSSGVNTIKALQKYGAENTRNRPRLGVHPGRRGLLTLLRPSSSVATIWRRVGRVSDAKIINFLNQFWPEASYRERFAATTIAGRWCPDEGQQRCPARQKRTNIAKRKTAVEKPNAAARRLKRTIGLSLRTNG